MASDLGADPASSRFPFPAYANGWFRAAYSDELAVGDLVITEMMGNPSCIGDGCEWFEVLNTTDLPIDLYGLGIGDIDAIDAENPDTYVLEHAILESGALGVFARDDLV